MRHQQEGKVLSSISQEVDPHTHRPRPAHIVLIIRVTQVQEVDSSQTQLQGLTIIYWSEFGVWCVQLLFGKETKQMRSGMVGRDAC